ncbi:unnamed protein product [Medioppia subpectinata]|uniref:C2H2-type domain-containing protein n=1 Tax=Medioppia subpectinata TaxID=1979941 RepID=A0A7R9Q324_9ACAR|nr:unnamed protein product [Medioppia subpectinata]CAG2110977.1 unnamed protein product [Medioppia subpectinata]
MHFAVNMKTTCGCDHIRTLIHTNDHHFNDYQRLKREVSGRSRGGSGVNTEEMATDGTDHTMDQTCGTSSGDKPAVELSLIESMKTKMSALTGAAAVVSPTVTDWTKSSPSRPSKRTKKSIGSRKVIKTEPTKPFEMINSDSEEIPIYPVMNGYRCGYKGCTYTATYRRFIEMHFTVHSTATPFWCGVNGCEMSFRSEQALTGHQSTAHPNPSNRRWIVCHRTGCRFRTKSRANWVEHNITHRSSDPQPERYTCDVCNKSYTRLTVLSEHMKLSHNSSATATAPTSTSAITTTIESVAIGTTAAADSGGDPYLCEHCPRTYRSLATLNTHVRREHRYPYVCDSEGCISRFESDHLLDEHRARVHGSGYTGGDNDDETNGEPVEEINDNNNPIDDELADESHAVLAVKAVGDPLEIPIFTLATGFVCGYPGCAYSARQRGAVTAHFAVHQTERPFRCRLAGCAMRFKTESVLSGHQIVVHPDCFPNRKWLHCLKPGCKYRTKLNSNYNKHVNSHTTRYRCDLCDKSYAERKYLVKHRRAAHTSTIRYGCDLCDKSYALQSALRVHVRRTHHKAYPCEYADCGRAFGVRADLQKHVRRVHDELYVRPIACTWIGCPLRFESTLRMTEHLRRHTGDKPLECPECDKRFATAGDRAAHVVNQHKDRRYACEWPGCQFRAAFMSQMRSHIKRHQSKVAAE